MSLLLEALKKAELAKQTAKEGAPSAEPERAPPEPAAPVITREKLPDISQPLEILTDDLPSSEPAGETATAGSELSLQREEMFEPAAQAIPSTNEYARTAERAQAQQLFQVKEMDYNPRRPFYLTLGALALVGLGYGGYVWWQMQPKYSAPRVEARPVAAPAQSAAAPAPVDAPPPLAAPAPPAPQAAAPVPARAAVPGIPPIQPVRPPRARSQPASGTLASGPSAPRSELSSTPSGSVSQRAGEALAPIAINAPTLSVDPLVEQAYQAFQRNDLAAARESYQRALAREPTNRDALLGLAAIDVRNGQLSSAEARYLKLLEIDPRDSHAVANLITLRGQLDPVASESRLKSLIATHPETALLHFSLGNQYAQQSRWAEAQSAYFKAYSVDPENADYAFNLAVSLDQLHQGKLALEYYQRALALTEKRAASFTPAQARLRVQELSK
jgi:tetratricopeptide (TPR) repeat protein